MWSAKTKRPKKSMLAHDPAPAVVALSGLLVVMLDLPHEWRNTCLCRFADSAHPMPSIRARTEPRGPVESRQRLIRGTSLAEALRLQVSVRS